MIDSALALDSRIDLALELRPDPAPGAGLGLEDCERLIADGLGWIDRHLAEFDPFKGGRPFAIRHGQRIGELAILAHVHGKLAGDLQGAAAGRRIELLRRVQATPEFSDRALRSPAELVLFAEVYGCLRQLGHDDPRQRALLAAAFGAGLLEQIERLPHRMMDIASCLESGGFDHPWPSLEELYGASILGRVPSPVQLSEDGLYALTHVILFLTGFGLRRPALPPGHAPALARTLTALIVGCCRERHWDLIAELLLCWECLGFAPSAISGRGWQALLAMRRGDGSLPGPEWALRKAGRAATAATGPAGKGPAPTVAAGSAAAGPATTAAGNGGEHSFDFSHHYHTTLVAVLAGFLVRRRLLGGTGGAGASDAGAAVHAPDSPPAGRNLHHAPPANPAAADATAAAVEAAATAADIAAAAAAEAAAVAAARRALPWLAGTLAAAGPSRPDALYRLLLGAWICRCLTGEGRAAFPAMARRIAGLLEAGADTVAVTASTEGPQPPQDLQAPPALALTAAAILASQGLPVPGLHGPDGFAARAAALLGTLPEAATADPALYDKRLLLHLMGLGPRPRPPAPSGLAALARSLSLAAPAADLEELQLLAESASAGGGRRLDLAPGDRWLGELLAGSAAHLLGQYDWPRACRALRACRYLGLDPAGPQLAGPLAFLRLHQRPEGSFGYFGPEERTLRSTLPDAHSVALDLRLPVTLEALWTLAESGGWRLFASLSTARQGLAPTGAAAAGDDAFEPAAAGDDIGHRASAEILAPARAAAVAAPADRASGLRAPGMRVADRRATAAGFSARPPRRSVFLRT